MRKATLRRDDDLVTPEEQMFLDRARSLFVKNPSWFEFEDFAFGSKSPVYARERSHRDVLQHPLYVALKEMWLDLGVRQGYIAVEAKDGVRHGARRKARGRR